MFFQCKKLTNGMVMFSPKMIKTSCGIDKYQQLKKDKSVWGKLRLTWFVAIATLRDLNNR